jgi:small-conductance mechanosensitive channel
MNTAKPILRNLLYLIAGVTLTERTIKPLTASLTKKFLSYLCQRNRALDDDGGFYCSTIPFATSLSSLTTRVICYSLLIGRYLHIDIKSILSGVGVYGLVLGWALNQVLKEAVSGALIVGAQPFYVGQRIIVRTQMMNFEGTVDAITLQHTVLICGKGPGDQEDEDTHTVLIPNSVLLKAVVRLVNEDESQDVNGNQESEYSGINSPRREKLNNSGFIDV